METDNLQHLKFVKETISPASVDGDRAPDYMSWES